MGSKATAVLIALAVGLGVLLWLDEPPPAPVLQDPPTLLGEPRLRDPSQFVPLLEFHPADVVALRLQRGDVSIESKRAGGGWSPPLTGEQVEEFLRSMAAMGRVMQLPPDSIPSDYGLDPPDTIVEFWLRQRETPVRLEIGNQNPAATGVYVRVGSTGPVILGGALISWEIDKLLRQETP